MVTTPITELDFKSNRDQLIAFLKRDNSPFKDYNFAGSNMAVLLDVLAYNTYQSNFYTNMAISEMFLDSAQMRNSVVSHAKELNYLPKSAVSSKAVVRITFTDTTSNSTVLIPANTKFLTNFQGTTYSFVTNKSYIALRVATNTFTADNVEIFEGTTLRDFEKEGFFLEETVLKCILTNQNVDLDSINISVNDIENVYTYRKDIFGVEPADQVYYLEPYFDNRYSVIFGKNIFGKQPSFDDDIQISYRITSGTLANGASRFTTSFKSNAIVETITAASGGADMETLESIKFFAPKSIQIQERAVTERDYAVLLKQKFTEIGAISVYGGDELDPPKYGHVAISVDLIGDNYLSSSKKNEYMKYIADKTPITIKPIFIDPEYLYANLVIDVHYSLKYTNKSVQELESLIRTAVSTYNTANLDDFGSTLRVSRLSSDIDAVDASIISNNIDARPIIEYSPPLNTSTNPIFKFQAAIVKPYAFIRSTGFDNYKPSITSSPFLYDGICSILQDDGKGNMHIVSNDINSREVLHATAGTVDYTSGTMRLVDFKTGGYTAPAIRIYADTVDNDITSPKNRVFNIRDTDITVNMIEIK